MFRPQPTPRHRCYLRPRGDRVDLALQASFCLTSSHTICPWLSIGTPAIARLDGRAGALRRAAGETMGPWPERVSSFAVASWVRLRPVLVRLGLLVAALAVLLWRHLHPALARAALFAWAQLRRGLRGLGRLALRAVSSALVRFRGAPGVVAMPALSLAVPAGETSPAAAGPEDPLAQQSAPEAARLVEQGIVAIREGSREVAYALFVHATELDAGYEQGWLWRAALSGLTEEKRECLEQMLRVNPENTSAKSALAMLERPEPEPPVPARPEVTPTAPPGPAPASGAGRSSFPGRTPVGHSGAPWQCAVCDAINTGPSRVCHSCGRPSPEVEEELTAGGDLLLAQGLAGLKAGNEELAHGYFAMACEATPGSELAWYWRAKTAPALDEVILCLEHLLEINPESAKARADLKWAVQRRDREQAKLVPPPQRPSVTAARVRRVTGRLRWLLLQLAGILTFVLGLALVLPYGLGLTDLPDRSAFGAYIALLPRIAPPELTLRLPSLSAFDLGPLLPLVLGLLLLHATFVVVDGGGLRVRLWTSLLCVSVGGVMLLFGTNPPAPTFAAGLAAVAVVAALAGDAQLSKP